MIDSIGVGGDVAGVVVVLVVVSMD